MKNFLVATNPDTGEMITSWDSVPQIIIDDLVFACQQKASEYRKQWVPHSFHTGEINPIPADGPEKVLHWFDDDLGIDAEKRGAVWSLVITGPPTWAHFVVRASAERLRNSREAA